MNPKTALLLLFVMALAGCQSGKFSHYISPRVTGRVLAADTQQPFAGATIRRVAPAQTTVRIPRPKGASS